VEIGIVFVFITIVSGSIWARPVWNTWWTWDPRLTTAAIMELIYIAYVMLRQAIDDPDRGRAMVPYMPSLGLPVFRSPFIQPVYSALFIRLWWAAIHPVCWVVSI
jgi:heme exporter protein C